MSLSSDLFLCISQGLGERPEVYGQGGHNGIDFVYEKRTPVYACHSGKGKYREEKDENGNFKGYGKYYTIIGEGFKTVYAHLDESLSNKDVKKGELIGYGDSTGFSTNHHLHLTTKLINEQGEILNRDNGLDGAVNPNFVWFENMKLTKNQILAIQALEGYFDPQGAEYWSDKELEEALLLAKGVGERHEKFSIALSHIQYGSSRNVPRMIWAIGQMPKELLSLQKDLEKTFSASTILHLMPEKRPYSLHLTLGRLDEFELQKIERDELPIIDEEVSWEIPVSSFEVMESQLKKGGAEYTVVHSFSLS